MDDQNDPLGSVSRSRLHFFFMADCSGSMKADGKVEALNTAVRYTLPILVEAADNNLYTSVYLRSITFASGARWHIGEATPIENVRWQDVTADGYTDLGAALDLLLVALDELEDRSVAPGLLLVSDGQPTDDYEVPLQALLQHRWGAVSQRIAIAIGADADFEFLRTFVGDDGVVLTADEPDRVAHQLRFAGETLLRESFGQAPRAASAVELDQVGPVWSED